MNYFIAAAVGAGVGVVAFWLLANIVSIWRSTSPARRPELQESERRFRSVFSMMNDDRRLSLVRYYMEKHGCDRSTAMQFALDDRTADADRWAS